MVRAACGPMPVIWQPSLAGPLPLASQSQPGRAPAGVPGWPQAKRDARRRGGGWPAAVGLASTLALLNLVAAGPRMSVEQWRAAAHDDRALAENDVPRAYAEAVRLKAALPADAAPIYQARALNLLARTEIYSGLTAQADGHARQALAIARRAGDRVGRAEADLNITLTSVNLGRIDELTAAATDAVAVLDGVNDPALAGEALL